MVPRELRRDAMSRDRGSWDGSRDRARTPMPWNASRSGGFTADGVTPWLPLGDAAARNVADQRRDPGSVLQFCRSLLALRRAELGGRVAPYEPLLAAPGHWAYRVGGLVITANLTDEPAVLPAPAGEVLLSTADGQAAAAPGAGHVLGPWQGIVAREQP
jgi:glycosidase